MKVFVSGIGTDVGKSVVSAILVEAFGADYWKPVQTGAPDTEFIESLVSRKFVMHPSVYSFKIPVSPHLSAQMEQTEILSESFRIPETDNHLVVEGAGGLLVPLSDNFLVADLIGQLQLPVILVSKHYLGSINHTLLSIALLRQRNIPLMGIVFNGNENAASESAVLNFGKTEMLFRVNDESEFSDATVRKYAERCKNSKIAELFQ